MAAAEAPKAGVPFPLWFPARRRFSPDDPFFNAGNVERELLAKQASLNISDEEKAYIGKMEEQTWQLSCPIVGCGVKLSCMDDLESHYFVRHTATCSVCNHVYPTKRLLSLHISESHDSFFQAKATRNYPMYECLVEDCGCKFTSDKARHQHLVDKHRFPLAFRFSRKSHPSQKQRQRYQAKRYVQGCSRMDEDDIDKLASGVSRLSTSDAKVPSAVTFGRKHNRGIGYVPRK